MVDDESEEDERDPHEGLVELLAVTPDALHNSFERVVSLITVILPEDFS